MKIPFVFILAALAVSIDAAIDGLPSHITCDWEKVQNTCPLSQYVKSVMDIFENNLGVDKEQLRTSVKQQWCSQTFKNDVAVTENCIKQNLGRQCWEWLEWAPGQAGPDYSNSLLGKNHRILFIYKNYAFCDEDEPFLEEYIDIRTCNRSPQVAVTFADRYKECMDSSEQNEIQEAMNRLDVCPGDNKEFSCAFDAMVGEYCPSIRDAILDVATIAGNTDQEIYEEEMYQIEFILRSAYIDNLRLPHPHECENVRTYRHKARGGKVNVSDWRMFIVVFAFIGIGIAYLLLKTNFRQEASNALGTFASSHKKR